MIGKINLLMELKQESIALKLKKLAFILTVYSIEKAQAKSSDYSYNCCDSSLARSIGSQ